MSRALSFFVVGIVFIVVAVVFIVAVAVSSDLDHVSTTAGGIKSQTKIKDEVSTVLLFFLLML